MDEPFGAVDELTRENLNDYLLELWRAAGKTIVFITHSVPEAVFLSDRVAILSPRPGRLVDVVDIDPEGPRSLRDRYSAEFAETIRTIREKLRE
jgi:NitT/TauT family transport system ATP-binding protein